MKIAIASGKGGTGKTTVAINLMLSIAELPTADRPHELVLLDCDVEEPNAHIFLSPHWEREEDVGILLPEVDLDACTYCGKCAEVCAFHAIAVMGENVLVFPQLCHGCGSCTYNCPEHAIHEVFNATGTLQWGHVDRDGVNLQVGQGVMNVGEAMATPIIHQLKRAGIPQDPGALTIMDAPPGNACPVVETLRNVDFALLVTEPTPFGLHDLQVAVQVARDELHIPLGVIVNRDGVGDEGVTRFCAEADIPILMRIPLDRQIAEAYAEGIPIIDAQPQYQAAFIELYQAIQEVLS